MDKTRLLTITGSLALVLGLVLGYLFITAAETTDAQTTAGTGARDTGHVINAGTTVNQREVVLSVPDMTCPMCPITVRQALAGIDGVNEATASLDDKQARVVFDPSKTDIDTLIAALAEAGFTARPSSGQ